jgi:hypothetical protein
VVYRCPKAPAGRAGRHERSWQARTRDLANTAGIFRTNRCFSTSASAASTSLLRSTSPECAATRASDAGLTTTDLTIGTKATCSRHLSRQLSRYRWAKLIARVYETDPLQCGVRERCCPLECAAEIWLVFRMKLPFEAPFLAQMAL